jgi:2-polyprenyl-6-methoxyphenol hydroxylase-like FAD-dependent oxidoreductase
MALEDADTLSYVLARAYSLDFNQAKDLPDLITKWEHHRQDRIARIADFTARNGKLRKSSQNVYARVAKECLIWAALKLMGPEGGAAWIFSYTPEDIPAILSPEAPI